MGKSLLFVDDDKSCLESVTAFLRTAGYEVLPAKDATQAMQLAGIDGVKLGLIIVDIDLAGESGLMLMKFLRFNHPGVPVLLYTGKEHDDATIRTMLDQGADQYLPKRSLDELLVTVGSYFRPMD